MSQLFLLHSMPTSFEDPKLANAFYYLILLNIFKKFKISSLVKYFKDQWRRKAKSRTTKLQKYRYSIGKVL